MKVTVPTAYRGLRFRHLTEITMDEFDVERLLPGLFFLVVTGGRARHGRVNDPLRLDAYIEELSRHERLAGFDTASGKRLLERWVRASVVRMSAAGKARSEEQIESLQAFSLLTYKAGWPEQGQRLRNVDRFLYEEMLDALNTDGSQTPPVARLRHVFKRTFGLGVEIDGAPPYDGRYDGETPVDAETLLGLSFLDTLQPTPAKNAPEPRGHQPALPGHARALATDVLAFMAAYGTRYKDSLPIAALTRGVMALINFELFVYTMRLVYAIAELVRTSEKPPAMQLNGGTTQPELFVDFTREKESPSDDLALWCTQRDLTAMRRFFEQLVLLRALDRFASDVRSVATAVAGLDGPDYLVELFRQAGSSEVAARAQAELGLIKDTSINAAPSSADVEEIEAYFRDLVLREDFDPLVTLSQLLAGAQARTRVESLVKWMGSVGGCNASFGFIRGTSKRRASWRYQMSDDLLASLVQLSVVHLADEEGRISLADFLRFLETRFGVIVARPPRQREDTATRAAARANLEAMKRRLRQMGFFADLSDDFTAQYIRSPLKVER
jgi:hypothetical protein